MGTVFLISALASCILCQINFATGSRIRIVDNGYENIVVALPVEAAGGERKSIVSALKDMFHKSSTILSQSTKKRAHFRSVTFLVPETWGEMVSWLSTTDDSTSFNYAGAAISRQDADVMVLYSSENLYPYVLHQGGCGRNALRIYFPANHLLSEDRKQRAVEFVRLWSEFRYGVFPEGGFEDDPKYPFSFFDSIEGSNITTGCSSGLNSQCTGLEKCSDDTITSSLMDQHLPNTAINFCENYLNLGPRHNPDAPSKHNLLCKEEGTWFTVLRSPDFIQGRNAAPKSSSVPEVAFRYVREVSSLSVIVAIDVSSQMSKEERYHLTKNAFYQFVVTMLPNGSDLTVLLFGGTANVTVATANMKLLNEFSKTKYLESLPLPDEPSSDDHTCIDCVLEDIFQFVTDENSTFESAPVVILVTASHQLDVNKFEEIQGKLRSTELLLQVMAFTDKINNDVHFQGSLYDLCLSTGNKFINLEGDTFRNLYNGFNQAVKGLVSRILVHQNYITPLDEENIMLDFALDESVTQELRVSMSGPMFSTTSTLEYDKTLLNDPSGNEVLSKKYEIVPSLNFHIQNPKTGLYKLKTRRKNRQTSPVLLSVYGTPVSIENLVTVNAWVEVSERKISPPPIQIFAEVRKGSYPIINASVKAYVEHPDGYVEVVYLLDDGQGGVDVTEGDGVYTHYFTNFTSTGFYNVFVKAKGGVEYYSEILKGPQSYCCGSSFTHNEAVPTGQFKRHTEPVTFRVTSVPENDVYPPARVTDLRIVKKYDQIVALKWTSVGNDFNSGEAACYELKLFRDRSSIRNRFSDSRLELYSETISVPSPTSYGTDLYRVLHFPKSLGKGVYYFGIRALDDARNHGEPSNAVAVRIEKNQSKEIDCTDDPTAEKLNNSSYSHSAFSSQKVLWVTGIFFPSIMPAYELSILTKLLPRNELGAVLKRVGALLLDKGVTLQKIDNLGKRELPYKIPHYTQSTHGHFFVLTFDGSPKVHAEVTKELKLDVDLLKYGFSPVYKDLKEECTLEEELLPPALRPSVQKLLSVSNKLTAGKKRPWNKYYIEWDYYHHYM
ncbi:hypothetical protein JTE90_028106 [Oedothorax gibbosus]|uniref:Small ribosomal subunit protein bS6m n=1 Tax=Oedothorax gibbosus TaxID=931172 RepID=A0AAV6VBE6_9ARAC|nr:hypothetical protein JTE90_028106 [Oedothorax gibbosus]